VTANVVRTNQINRGEISQILKWVLLCLISKMKSMPLKELHPHPPMVAGVIPSVLMYYLVIENHNA
jgi:hypothetical protein